MILTRRYRYRIYPTTDQQTILVQWAGCRRWVWNWALRRKQEHYQRTKKGLSFYDLSAELTQIKRHEATLWLRDCVAQVLQQTLMDLDRAFTNFFEKRARYPKFKSRKKTRHSMRFPQQVMVIDGTAISVPKLGRVRAIIHRPLHGIVKSASIQQDAADSWWVSFVCHIDRPDTTPTCNVAVGIDVGLESFTTLHTSEKTAPPKFYRRGERRIKRLQRQLSRSQKGSKNRQKARKKFAKAHRHVRNQRIDWLHKQALNIIHQYDTVCIETLNIKGLVRTKLAKSFSDAAVSTFIQMLKDKAQWHGRQIVSVDRFFASSKICHCCHAKTALTLSDRVWTCSTCNTVHDRDVNAAINILHEGLRIVAAGMTET